MSLLLPISDRIYLSLNGLSGRSAFLDYLLELTTDNNFVKAAPICAAFLFAWCSGRTEEDRRRIRAVLLATLVATGVVLATTKVFFGTGFNPRPFLRSVPVYFVEDEKLVRAPELELNVPRGKPLERVKSLNRGEISATDLASFPSDHAAIFFALSLGIAAACRRAGAFALVWTGIIVMSRVITGLHSPLDVIVGIIIGALLMVAMLAIARRWLGFLFDPVARWTIRQEPLAAALLFLILFEIGSLFPIARQVLQVPKVKALLAAIAGLTVTGCGFGQHREGLIVEDGWRPEIIASERSGISSPDGLRWVGAGLLIADEGGQAIRLWRSDGGIVTLADRRSGIRAPEDLVADGKGNVYFTDDKVGGLWRTDRSGRTAQLVGAAQGLGPTEGIALEPSGRILVGDPVGHRIVSVGTNGDMRTFVSPSTGIKKPESLAFAPHGALLFISDNDAKALYVLTRDGRLHRPLLPLAKFSPEGIAFSRYGLLITDKEYGKLYRYSPLDGLKTIAVFGGDMSSIQGVAEDPAGNIYVSIQSNLKERRGYLLRLSRTR